MRRTASTLLVLLFSLLFTGCVKVDVGMELNSSGGGIFRERLTVEKTGLSESGLTDDTFNAELDNLDLSGAEVTDIETTEDGKTYVGKEISFKFSSFKDLDRKLAKVFNKASDTVANTNDAVNQVSKYVTSEGAETVLNMPADTFISGAVGESKYNYGIDAVFYLVMPNIEVISSNADRVNGERYEWDLLNREDNIRITYKRASDFQLMLEAILVIFLLSLALLLVAFIARPGEKGILQLLQKNPVADTQDTKHETEVKEPNNTAEQETDSPVQTDDE